ncbi:hypothetical protein TNCV_2297401 [Trichonephila clavipes]|nr:hypothetical protein TNCV_2297401 [Trichonephila clavipes]
MEFYEEMRKLLAGEPIPMKSKLTPLNVFLDESNIIRWLATLTAVLYGLGSNPREDMDVCKRISSFAAWGTLNSRRAASPLLWLVEGEESNTRTIGDRPRSFEPQSSDEDDILAGITSKYQPNQTPLSFDRFSTHQPFLCYGTSVAPGLEPFAMTCVQRRIKRLVDLASTYRAPKFYGLSYKSDVQQKILYRYGKPYDYH